MIEWPEIGTPVYLVLGEGVNFTSRLTRIERDSFEVAAPLESTFLPGLEPVTPFELFWTVRRTRMVLPSRLLGTSDEAPYRWYLAPAGETREEDRREFARGGAGAAVRLMAGSDQSDHEGRLLDISENGMRCWISGAEPMKTGDPVRAVVWLGSGEADLSTQVHAIRDADEGPGRHLILRFEAPAETAAMIREYVAAWQMGERRRNRRQRS